MTNQLKQLFIPKLIFLLFLIPLFIGCNGLGYKSLKGEKIKIMTWNLYNFGKSKNEEEIEYIAEKVRNFDVLAIQEVSTSPPGAQAVARLAEALNRKGAKWNYQISPATEGKGTERYAFLWKTNKLKLVGKLWLVSTLKDIIDREPCMARFETKNGHYFLLANFHAVPKYKHPEHEIYLLDNLPDFYPNDELIFAGDFNLSQKNKAFNELKNLSYSPCITNQKTSLKRKVKKRKKLAQEYDNIFFDKKYFYLWNSGVIHFYQDFSTLKQARKISDHIPVWIEIGFK